MIAITYFPLVVYGRFVGAIYHALYPLGAFPPAPVYLAAFFG